MTTKLELLTIEPRPSGGGYQFLVTFEGQPDFPAHYVDAKTLLSYRSFQRWALERTGRWYTMAAAEKNHATWRRYVESSLVERGPRQSVESTSTHEDSDA